MSKPVLPHWVDGIHLTAASSSVALTIPTTLAAASSRALPQTAPSLQAPVVLQYTGLLPFQIS